MPSLEERLSHILPKLNRADKHLGDLDKAIKEFHATDPYASIIERDPKTGECFQRMTKVEPIPTDVRLIAGDAIQNLMSALDHLAYQLAVVSGGGKAANPEWVYFPVGKDAPDYQAKREGKIKGCRQDILDELDLIQPHKGGHGEGIFTLQQLNNIEKHRLIFAVGATLSHWDVVPPKGGAVLLKSVDTGESFEIKFGTLRAAELMVLKNGDEISRFPCKSKINEYTKARVGVAICEPDVLPIQEMVPLIFKLGKEVEKVINRLTRFL